jgi:hypothetical protein
MEWLTRLVEPALAAVGLAYWVATGLALVAVVILYAAAEARRRAMAAAMNPTGRAELSLLSLSHGNGAERLRQFALVVPERLWTYDQDYVQSFAVAARSARVGTDTALSSYIEKVLAVDIAFAIALALFAALFDFAVATALLPAYGWAGRIVLLTAAMALLYGAADVAEDIKLRMILRQAEAIDAAETAAANALTRLKIVALTLSISGVLTFLALSMLARASGSATPTPRPQPTQSG